MKISDHTTEVIDVQDLSDGALAVRVRCCGDPQTDSVCTVYELHRPKKEIEATVHEHHARVQLLHHHKHLARQHVKRLIGKKHGPCHGKAGAKVGTRLPAEADGRKPKE